MAHLLNLLLVISCMIHGSAATIWSSRGFHGQSLKILRYQLCRLIKLTLYGRILNLGFLKAISSRFQIFKTIFSIFIKAPWMFQHISRNSLPFGNKSRDCTYAIPYTCGAASDLRKYKSQDRVLKFLKGLNDSLSTSLSKIPNILYPPFNTNINRFSNLFNNINSLLLHLKMLPLNLMLPSLMSILLLLRMMASHLFIG